MRESRHFGKLGGTAENKARIFKTQRRGWSINSLRVPIWRMKPLFQVWPFFSDYASPLLLYNSDSPSLRCSNEVRRDFASKKKTATLKWQQQQSEPNWQEFFPPPPPTKSDVSCYASTEICKVSEKRMKTNIQIASHNELHLSECRCVHSRKSFSIKDDDYKAYFKRLWFDYDIPSCVHFKWIKRSKCYTSLCFHFV